MLGIGGAAALAGCAGGNGTDSPTGTATDTDQGGLGTDTSEVGGTVDEFPDVEGTYTTVTSASFSTLNPLYNTENGAGTAIGRALDMGYTFDGNQEFFPLLYDMSTENGKVWTFTLRENLQFGGDYGQVTAEDFVYQIQELHQAEWTATADTTAWNGVTVEQTGEFEFQAELESANVLWPESFDPLLYPIPKDLVQPYVEEQDAEGLQQDEELLELQFTGNLGAFTLDNWERGAGTEYSRNDEYYLRDIDEGPEIFSEGPYFEGAEITVVEEQSSRLGALEAGETDSAAIPPERFQEFQEMNGVDVYQIPQPYNEVVMMNMRDNGWNAGPGNLFRYVEFRQAMAMAVDKQKLIQGVWRGRAAPHYTWQPQWSAFYPEDESRIPQFGTGDQYGSEVAREKAREAFDMSDYDYSFDGDTMVNPDGDQVALEFYHSSGQNTEQLEAEFVAQELGKNLGMDVQVKAINGTKFDQDYFQTPAEGGSDTIYGEEVTWDAPGAYNGGPRSVTSNEPWDMSLVYGLNTYPRNPLTNSAFFDGPTAYFNAVGYYPRFDAQGLFDEAAQATSRDEIKSAFEDIFVNLAKEQPYLMLVFTDSTVGYTSDLVGPIENFSNGWDLPGWHFEDE